MALADAIPDRFSALVLVLAFGGLRSGEATALRRGDVAQDRSEVRIERSVRTGRVGSPKTDAGRRVVALPQFVAEALAAHMDRYTPGGNDALVFGTASGNFLARQNFTATFKRAVERRDLPAVRVQNFGTPERHSLRKRVRPPKNSCLGSATRAPRRRLATNTPVKGATANLPGRSML